MIRTLKVIFLALLFGGMGAVALIDRVAIGWYPPVAQLPGGESSPFAPVDVRSCMGARLWSSLGDVSATRRWHHCQTVLQETQALGAFGWRYWGLVISCAITLLAPFGFAFAFRLDRDRSRVLRGRRLLTGDHARRSFLRSAEAESRMSGAGLELLPGLAVSRERETRHWLIRSSDGAV